MNLINQNKCRAKFDSQTTRWYEIKNLPGFPKPVTLPTGGKRKKSRPLYIEEEIDKFIESLAAQREVAQ